MSLNFESSLSKVALDYSTFLNAKITKTSLKNSLENNFHYPSLLSLSEVFDNFKIRNSALSVPKADILTVPTPFIAYVSQDSLGSDFVFVTNIDNNSIYYKYDTHKEIKSSLTQFKEGFKEIVFIAEVTEFSGDANYSKAKALERKSKLFQIASYVAACLCIIIFPFTFFPMQFWISLLPLYLLQVAGMTVSTIVLSHEITHNNYFVRKVCSSFKSRCDSVLLSKSSNIFGIKLSFASFIYFFSSFLLLIDNVIPIDYRISILQALSLLSIPICIFSIYYQARVIKHWCIFCLAILTILALEFIILLANTHKLLFFADHINIKFYYSVLCLALFLLVSFIFWQIVHSPVAKLEKFKSLKTNYHRLISNPGIFNVLLMQAEPIAPGWDSIGIDLSDPKLPITIVNVCSPYCHPCANMHFELENLMSKNLNVNVKVIFSTNNDHDSIGFRTAEYLTTLSKQYNKTEYRIILNDWYKEDKKDLQILKDKYHLSEVPKFILDEVSAMNQWCSAAEILYTPTIFINGRIAPDNYTVNEISSLLMINGFLQ